jgi:hypothetical protein
VHYRSHRGSLATAEEVTGDTQADRSWEASVTVGPSDVRDGVNTVWTLVRPRAALVYGVVYAGFGIAITYLPLTGGYKVRFAGRRPAAAGAHGIVPLDTPVDVFEADLPDWAEVKRVACGEMGPLAEAMASAVGFQAWVSGHLLELQPLFRVLRTDRDAFRVVGNKVREAHFLDELASPLDIAVQDQGVPAV